MIDRYKQPPLQEPREFQEFIDILKAEGVRSYLEIGSMWGGSLWQVAHSLPVGSRIVSVDAMVDHPEAEPSLRRCIKQLNELGYDAHFILGDSMDRRTIESARALGPFDALFIDGEHAPKYVMADWLNYGPMARIVGFHDINWNKTWRSARPGKSPDETRMGAPAVWNQVKQGRRFKELRYHPPQNYYGIGVIWNAGNRDMAVGQQQVSG